MKLILKSENKDTANEYGYYLESNFAGGVSTLFLLVYSNQDNNSKKV